jgi:hypothetical protein
MLTTLGRNAGHLASKAGPFAALIAIVGATGAAIQKLDDKYHLTKSKFRKDMEAGKLFDIEKFAERTRPEMDIPGLLRKETINNQKKMNIHAPMSVSVDASSKGGIGGGISAGGVGKAVGVAIKAEFAQQMKKLLVAAE